jgi:hypothetical protein
MGNLCSELKNICLWCWILVVLACFFHDQASNAGTKSCQDGGPDEVRIGAAFVPSWKYTLLMMLHPCCSFLFLLPSVMWRWHPLMPQRRLQRRIPRPQRSKKLGGLRFALIAYSANNIASFFFCLVSSPINSLALSPTNGKTKAPKIPKK